MKNKEKIKTYFLKNPNSKMRVRMLEREINVSLPSVIRYCNELEEESLISEEIIGNVKFYVASKNEKYVLEKKLFNIRKIYESGLIKYFKEKLSNPTIVLFGSYFKGENDEDSDVDLYIETVSDRNLNLKKFEDKLGKIQIFRYKTLNDVENPHLANNIINGLVLNGALDVFR